MDTRVKGSRRMEREARTVEAMIALHCRQVHGSAEDLCPRCATLHTLARRRLEKCPFQAGKTTCARCPVHCYKPQMREEIRAVMRYSGPRMLLRHPILAALHLVDGLRKAPAQPLRPSSRKGEGSR